MMICQSIYTIQANLLVLLWLTGVLTVLKYFVLFEEQIFPVCMEEKKEREYAESPTGIQVKTH